MIELHGREESFMAGVGEGLTGRARLQVAVIRALLDDRGGHLSAGEVAGRLVGQLQEELDRLEECVAERRR